MTRTRNTKQNNNSQQKSTRQWTKAKKYVLFPIFCHRCTDVENLANYIFCLNLHHFQTSSHCLLFSTKDGPRIFIPVLYAHPSYYVCTHHKQSLLEQRRERGRGQMKAGNVGTVSVRTHCHSGWVSSEKSNVLLYPPQCRCLVL